jgi:hypothetical protein
MKKFFLSAIAFALIIACNNAPEATAEETTEVEAVEEETPTGVFGDQNITEEGAISTSEMLAMLDGQEEINVKVSTTINQCCQKKGCWMDVDLGNGQTMIVKFKDYEFFVPKNAAGHTAILEGVAKVEVQDVEWLRHKAEDAGQTAEEIAAITEPETSVTFVADAVIIK